MADQTTSVAQLPAGYATLAGVIYAVAATSPKTWNYTAWSKMHVNCVNKSSGGAPNQPSQDLGPSQDKEAAARLAQKIAALHLLSSVRKSEGSSGLRDDGGLTSNDLESRRHLRANSNSSSDIDSPLAPAEDQFDLYERFPAIEVYIHGPKTFTNHGLVSLTLAEFRAIATEVAATETDHVTDSSLVKLLACTNSEQTTRLVHAQAAASFDYLIIELVYKVIEFLVASAIILGSSGGVWPGLTLASMFPQRIAAGLYVSSYGQSLSRSEIASQQSVHVWRPAGTIWTDAEPDPYKIPPRNRLNDQWRNAIGYWLQYGILFAYQNCKLPIRDALSFGPYQITRDAIRYILLVIQLFMLIFYGMTLRVKLRQKLHRRDIISGTIYLIMLAAGLTCVVLGQKSFLKPIWKFYLTSRIVDPIAAIGVTALMNLDFKKESVLPPEKWVLLWTLGACTVVW